MAQCRHDRIENREADTVQADRGPLPLTVGVDYAAFQAAGYPIGSGSTESANKIVVEVRLRGATQG